MTKNVYQMISECMGELAKLGISKDRKNASQGYNFRGIDEVYNALAPVLHKVGLVVLPRVLSRTQTERTTAKGGVLIYSTVEVEFDFVSSKDSSTHTVKTFGEAMDSGDKSTNKAMSAAYKYAAIQTFCIPTEGDNDADATTHVVAPMTAAEKLDMEAQHLGEKLGRLAEAADAEYLTLWTELQNALTNYPEESHKRIKAIVNKVAGPKAIEILKSGA